MSGKERRAKKHRGSLKSQVSSLKRGWQKNTADVSISGWGTWEYYEYYEYYAAPLPIMGLMAGQAGTAGKTENQKQKVLKNFLAFSKKLS